MKTRCENCNMEGNILDMWEVKEPVEEGQRTSHFFCCRTCEFEYWVVTELANLNTGN